MTKLASIATRSTATQTTHSVTDGSSLQQWRSTQGKYWLELRGLQHSIQQILTQTRNPSRKLPARTPTAVLEQRRDRIRSISLDMNAFSKSCSVEMATSSAPQSRLRAPVQRHHHGGPASAERRKQRTIKKRTRRNQRRRRRCEGGEKPVADCKCVRQESSSVFLKSIH